MTVATGPGNALINPRRSSFLRPRSFPSHRYSLMSTPKIAARSIQLANNSQTRRPKNATMGKSDNGYGLLTLASSELLPESLIRSILYIDIFDTLVGW